MKIYYEIEVNEIPKDCLHCPCNWCNLPIKKNCYEPTVKVKYRKHRHKDCPLKVIDRSIIKKEGNFYGKNVDL